MEQKNKQEYLLFFFVNIFYVCGIYYIMRSIRKNIEQFASEDIVLGHTVFEVNDNIHNKDKTCSLLFFGEWNE
jgi:hypothetical protein